MTDYTTPDAWLDGILEDAQGMADEAMLDTVQDAATLFVGSVARNGTIPGRMAGVIWSTRRDTGRAGDSIRVATGDVTDFPAPERSSYLPRPALVARAAADIARRRVGVMSVGTNATDYYEHLEGRFGAFDRTVRTLFERLDAT
jgi:hypothetical protein